MLYSNDKVSHVYRPGDSSIVVTLSKKYDFVMDAAESGRLSVHFLDNIDRRNYWIVDFRNATFAEEIASISLEELMIAVNSVYASVWHHPNVRQVLFVTDNKILQSMVEGLNSEAFGNLNIRVFATMENALAYARSQRQGTHITYQGGIPDGGAL